MEFLKKLRGHAVVLVLWFCAVFIIRNGLVNLDGATQQAWSYTRAYMIFLFIFVPICMIARSRITLFLVAIYGLSFSAHQIATVLDMNYEYLVRVGERIAPLFSGIEYAADQLGFGLGELAVHGIGAVYGFFIGVVACAAWCFVHPGDGVAKSRRSGKSSTRNETKSTPQRRKIREPGKHEAMKK